MLWEGDGDADDDTTPSAPGQFESDLGTGLTRGSTVTASVQASVMDPGWTAKAD
jgi:hypothetical protein